jgi:galactokinase/mevalonate kinase-like predicted kinase
VRLSVSAPARANLIGNPSDLYGGTVIGCAVPCRARAAFSEAPGLVVATGEEAIEFTSDADLALRGDVFDIARAALAAEPDRASLRVRIDFDTEIPFGSGIAGSTALLTAIVRGLAAWRGETPSLYELAERVRRTEREGLGVACGWVDAYLCSFGGLRSVDLRGKQRAFATPGEPFASVEDLAPFVPALPFVLGFTGVAHHSGSVHAPIRARWEQGDPAVVSGYERVAAIAREGKTALLRGEWPRLGALMNENHAIQRDFGGSGEPNEKLIEAALRAGALGAKLAGAGGGGTIVALWTHADPAPIERALRGAGASALYRPAPVAGVTIHPEAR